MRLIPRLIAGCALFLFGCGFAHNVVTSPVRLFHHPSPTPIPSDTTVTTTTHSEVTTPGRVQSSPVQALSPHRPTHYVKSSPAPSPTKSKQAKVEATPKPKLVPSVQSAPPEQNFPTAKSVPDKPGYVFSPSEPTKYVDVSGYPPGSKVKDPYSGEIFLVP